MSLLAAVLVAIGEEEGGAQCRASHCRFTCAELSPDRPPSSGTVGFGHALTTAPQQQGMLTLPDGASPPKGDHGSGAACSPSCSASPSAADARSADALTDAKAEADLADMRALGVTPTEVAPASAVTVYDNEGYNADVPGNEELQAQADAYVTVISTFGLDQARRRAEEGRPVPDPMMLLPPPILSPSQDNETTRRRMTVGIAPMVSRPRGGAAQAPPAPPPPPSVHSAARAAAAASRNSRSLPHCVLQ